MFKIPERSLPLSPLELFFSCFESWPLWRTCLLAPLAHVDIIWLGEDLSMICGGYLLHMRILFHLGDLTLTHWRWFRGGCPLIEGYFITFWPSSHWKTHVPSLEDPKGFAFTTSRTPSYRGFYGSSLKHLALICL